ncbi:hypothetical protein BDV11DRAFT_194291 [Aspergillus similis]
MAHRTCRLSFLVLLGVCTYNLYRTPLAYALFPAAYFRLSGRSRQHTLISSERDGFDLIFSNFSTNYSTESGLQPPFHRDAPYPSGSRPPP